MEKVIFAAKKAYYMIRVPAGLKDNQGNKIRPVYYSFEPTSLGFAYATSDKDAIDWIRKQDLFVKGLIWEMDKASTKIVQMGPQVVQGGAMSPQEPEPEPKKKGRK